MGTRKAQVAEAPVVLVRICEVLAELADDPNPNTWVAEAEQMAETMRGQVSKDWRGHAALSPLDAERLFLRMKRDRAQAREEHELRLVAADEAFRARLWRGLPADRLPVGVSAADAMFAADRAVSPKRESVLQHALSNGGQPVYHPIRDEAP